MDIRLQRRKGRRFHKLRSDDLEELARAIVLVSRKRGTIGVNRYRNIDYIELVTTEGFVQVLREDWVKILPYLQDGSFSQGTFPADVQTGLVSYSTGSFGLVQRLNAGTTAGGEIQTGRGDRNLYLRILSILRGIFTDEFPTQD